MNSSDAQKSEVHAVTADAEGSPTSDADEQATLEHARRRQQAPTTPPAINPKLAPVVGHTVILRDDTDVGGPLVITSDDPDLNPPHVPVDPFPTDRTPEIDPPID